MKVLTKNVFYYWNPEKVEVPKLWHNCQKYKDRDLARVELETGKITDDTVDYRCGHCDFTYTLDRHLRLEVSRM